MQPIQEVLGFFLGVKWLGCEVDHCALPSSAEVYNKWNYAFASPYAFMAWIRTAILFFLSIQKLTVQFRDFCVMCSTHLCVRLLYRIPFTRFLKLHMVIQYVILSEGCYFSMGFNRNHYEVTVCSSKFSIPMLKK
jgi:hypothetical protein